MSAADARSVPAPLAAIPASGRAGAAPGTRPGGALLAPEAGLARSLRALAERVTNRWLPQLSWSVARTGRSGLVGLALLGASAVFFVSTHLQVAGEVAQLRADVLAAQVHAVAAPQAGPGAPAWILRNLPARSEVPQVLGVLLKQADDAQLTIDTAKYEISATRAGDMVRYRLSFPVDGPYPKIRQFVDSTLRVLPAVAIDELSIARKNIGDQNVEAQVRMTIFTRGSS